ncbi:MAG: hypothetical protein AAFX99_00280 [Myxococcota bacterium]
MMMEKKQYGWWMGVALCGVALLGFGCSEDEDDASTDDTATQLSGTVDATGLALQGMSGTALEGVELTVAAGALPEGVEVTVVSVDFATVPPLPEQGVSVGPLVEVQVSDSSAQGNFSLKLPFDQATVAANGQDSIQVKVWHRPPDGWALLEPTSLESSFVEIESQSFASLFGAGIDVAPAE